MTSVDEIDEQNKKSQILKKFQNFFFRRTPIDNVKLMVFELRTQNYHFDEVRQHCELKKVITDRDNHKTICLPQK